jgi:hypothetical protein
MIATNRALHSSRLSAVGTDCRLARARMSSEISHHDSPPRCHAGQHIDNATTTRSVLIGLARCRMGKGGDACGRN